MRAGVEPGDASAHRQHVEFAPLEIGKDGVYDFQFATRRGFQLRGDFDDAVVVEVQPHYRVPRLRLRGLLLDADCTSVRVEFDYTVALRVLDRIGEYRSSALALCRAPQQIRELVPVKDVVAQHQRDRILTDEIAPDEKSLRQALGFRLYRVGS